MPPPLNSKTSPPAHAPFKKLLKAAFGGDPLTASFSITSPTYHQSQLSKENVPLPTEVFHRQCFVTTGFDKAGFKQPDFIGVDNNILWQAGLPQSTSTYPETAAAVAANLGRLSADERERITRGNAAKLYAVV